MFSSKISILLCLLTLPLLLQSVLGANPLSYFCSSSGNFSAYDPYEANLNKLIGYLFYQTPSTGFGMGSIGQKPHQANGLALCRGDVSSSDCKTCIAEAGIEIRKRCPSNKGAIVWYDNCLVKYSNIDFFEHIDNQNKFYMYNIREVNNSVTFNQKTKELLSRLAEEAYGAPKLYATGEMELEGSTKLYGLTQCTRDLSRVDCNKCLEGIIGELPSCCDAKEGGRVIGGSCNFIYEIYPFVNA